MQNTINADIAPFKMYGNLYFVGCSRVSVHVIDTGSGLIMIDTGYPDMYEQITDSMKTVGLDPKDICAIFHSHGHIDHFGCTCKLKEMSAAKTYISRIDNDIVNGTYDLSWAKELGYERLPFFNCDVLVEDGDCFTFGNTTVRCRLTPGHTAGVLSFFVNIEDRDKSIISAMHGGVGFNSMSKEFLKRYNLSFDCRDKFREGLHKLANEHVDLVMGNHPEQNDTPGKLKKVISGESIVDPTEWRHFLALTEERLDELINSENNQE
jgi:metallo-beta-lactamase class B